MTEMTPEQFGETVMKEFDRLQAAREDYEGVTHAGIAVVAADSGLILFAQRAMDETDAPDVQETFEFPGGGLEPDEDPQAGAFREFSEEIGFDVPPGEVVNGWRSENGVYQLFIYLIPEQIPLDSWQPTAEVQSVAWMTPDQAMEAGIRPEMADFPWYLLDTTDMDTDALVASGVSGNEEDVSDDEMDFSEVFAEPIPIHGVLAPEGVATGDKRGFNEGSMSARPYRLPFRWQDEDTGEHNGAKVVGSVDRLMRKNNLIHWEGRLMPSSKADEFAGLMEFFGGRYGVSVDGDNGSLDMEKSKAEGIAWFDAVRASGLTAVDIPAFAEAYVAFGAHPEMPEEDSDEFAVLRASGDLVGHKFDRGPGWVTNPKETKTIHDYWMPGHPGGDKINWGTPGDFRRAKALIGEKILKHSPEKAKYLNQIIAQWHFDALGYWPGDLGKPGNAPDTAENRKRAAIHAASSHGIEALSDGDTIGAEWEAVLTASGGSRVKPPIEYFHRHPDSMGTTIEEPDENGFRRVHGYAAEWGVCHIGYGNRCVEPPRTYSDDYPQFHKGRTKVEGGFVPTGVLTYNVEHRDAQTILSESATQSHFDNLKNAWAAVRIGEDERGIWYSGVVLPKVDEDDLTKIAASGQVSGEWKYDALRALLTVNVEGFEIERPSAAYDDEGNVVALAASAFGQVTDSPCTPTPAERMAAMRLIDAEVRFAALKEQYLAEQAGA